VSLLISFRLGKRGGGKKMRVFDGSARSRKTDSALVKALARAFSCKHMLESGEFATISELAGRGGITATYRTRTMRLAPLARDIVEAIPDGRQPRKITLEAVRLPLPVAWDAQALMLAVASGSEKPE
jgi:hypothetical protein